MRFINESLAHLFVDLYKVFLGEEELHSTFFAILHNTSIMVSRLYRQANDG